LAIPARVGVKRLKYDQWLAMRPPYAFAMRAVLLVAVILVAVILVAGCAPVATPEPVLASGAVAQNECERAVVARAELARDEGATAAEALEGDVYAACTFDEFVAANAKLADGYRYTGDIHNHVGRRCLRLISLYRGSRLCESLPPD
jgi:hypothetical protein